MCEHEPCCHGADAPDWHTARIAAAHPEQGWSLLCNGVVLFDDLGALLPNGRIVSLLPRPSTPRTASMDLASATIP